MSAWDYAELAVELGGAAVGTFPARRPAEVAVDVAETVVLGAAALALLGVVIATGAALAVIEKLEGR